MSDNCIFCSIISRSVPADIVFEDDYVIAINDIQPKAPVHVLVIPKEHVVTWSDLDPANADVFGSIAKAVQFVIADRNIAESGYKVVNNNGEDGGQAVHHMHFHILGGKKLKGVT